MSDGAASERRELWLAGTVDAVITAYALWTVVSTLTTVTGTSARAGLGGGSLLMLGLAALAMLPRVRARWLPSYLADLRQADELAPFAPSPRLRAGLLLASAGTAALWLATRAPVLAWASSLVVCAALVVAGLRHPPAPERPEPRPPLAAWQLYAVHALALGCALLTLLCVRPRTDDPFYINTSVGIADHPERPLLAVATMHGPATDRLPEQPMFVPYRVHSFESLGGYLSYLTGIDAIAVVHFGLATFFGWFAVLALTRLFRIVAPRHWLLALVVTLAYYVVEGSAGRGFANQAFVRMFHGKAAMLTAVVPLILAYGIRHGLRPSRPRFALLAFAQISAMGLTSTAIWLAPILAMVAVVGSTAQPKRFASAAAQAALSSGYVLAMGLWVRAQMTADARHVIAETVSTGAAASFTDLAFRRLGSAIGQALGGERAALTLSCAVALACVLAERAAVCRVLGALGLVLVALLANPWLGDFVASSITGALTYERVFWLLPVPVAFGLCASGTAALLEGRLGATRATLAAVLVAGALLGTATERLVLSEANGVTLRFPPVLKTSERLRRVAAEACRLAPEGRVILASEPISRQIAMHHHCGHPLIAAMRWMRAPLEEERRRTFMQRYVTDRHDQVSAETAARFREQLLEYDVAVVVMTSDAMANRPIKEALRAQGFEKVAVVLKHHVYALPAAKRVRRSGAPPAP